MTDNVAYTPGSGATIAAKDVSGVEHQRVLNETLNAAGTPTDVSAANPMPVTLDVGTLLQRIEMLELIIGRLLSGAGAQQPDPAGRTRVTVENWAATLTSIGKLNGVGIGALDAGPAYNNMMNLPALMLRDRIAVV